MLINYMATYIESVKLSRDFVIFNSFVCAACSISTFWIVSPPSRDGLA